MPPTIHTSQKDSSKDRDDKRVDLLCKVKFSNTLPDIPFDPKFLKFPFDEKRFVEYKPTSLEHLYKHDLLTNPDVGVLLDLIDPEAYEPVAGVYLHPDDEKLLEDSTKSDGRTSRHTKHKVSWLRKTEYISTEYNRFTPRTDQTERKVGYSLKKSLGIDEQYKDRDSQIAAIEKTFQDNKIPIVHHFSKPGVTAVEVLPLLPDLENWKHPCAQVIFDTDPMTKNVSSIPAIDLMSQAMIRGMVDEQNQQFVAYFLPTEETCRKRKRDQDSNMQYVEDEVYDYVLAGEFDWNVKNKKSKGYEETFFFVFRDNAVHYNELETRVRLSKRRKIGRDASNVTRSRLLVSHRALASEEVQNQHTRLSMLNLPGDEDEDQEEEGEEGKAEIDESVTNSPAVEGTRSPKVSDSDDSSDGNEGSEIDEKTTRAEAIFGSDSSSSSSSDDDI